jgi:hypothetical protein
MAEHNLKILHDCKVMQKRHKEERELVLGTNLQSPFYSQKQKSTPLPLNWESEAHQA